MKFHKDHIALLAGLVDEDDLEDTRNKLAEGLMIERRDSDLKEVSDRTMFLEYKGFDPDPYDNGEMDDEHPEKPLKPTGYEYYDHATPGVHNEPGEDPGSAMERIRNSQESHHNKTQLGVRGPGGQVKEFHDKMNKLLLSCNLNEECSEDINEECGCDESETDECSVKESMSLRDKVLHRWSLNESTDESVTMGFMGLGFGDRKNKSYTGYGSEHDSKKGYTIWDKQIEEACKCQDLGLGEDPVFPTAVSPYEEVEPNMEMMAGEEPAEVANRRKVTGFEDDPFADKTFGKNSAMGQTAIEPEDCEAAEEMDLLTIITNAIKKSRLGESLDMMAMTYEELKSKYNSLPPDSPMKSKIKKELLDRKKVHKSGGLRGAQ